MMGPPLLRRLMWRPVLQSNSSQLKGLAIKILVNRISQFIGLNSGDWLILLPMAAFYHIDEVKRLAAGEG